MVELNVYMRVRVWMCVRIENDFTRRAQNQSNEMPKMAWTIVFIVQQTDNNTINVCPLKYNISIYHIAWYTPHTFDVYMSYITFDSIRYLKSTQFGFGRFAFGLVCLHLAHFDAYNRTKLLIRWCVKIQFRILCTTIFCVVFSSFDWLEYKTELP